METNFHCWCSFTYIHSRHEHKQILQSSILLYSAIPVLQLQICMFVAEISDTNMTLQENLEVSSLICVYGWQ